MKTFLLTLCALFTFNGSATSVSATAGQEAITKYLKENFTQPVHFSGVSEDGAIHFYVYQFENGRLHMGGEVESDGLVGTLIGEEFITEEGLILPIDREGESTVVTGPSQCEVIDSEVDCQLIYEIRSAHSLWKINTHYKLSPSRRKVTSSTEFYVMEKGKLVLQHQGTESFEVRAE